MMVTRARKRALSRTQREMIINVFEFDDIDAGDIMTHRVDMAVEADNRLMRLLKPR